MQTVKCENCGREFDIIRNEDGSIIEYIEQIELAKLDGWETIFYNLCPDCKDCD